MSTRAEQETTTSYTAEDDWVLIYTCIPRDIRALERRENCETVEHGKHRDGTAFARFRVAREHWKLELAVRPTTNASEKQREAAARNLRKAVSSPGSLGILRGESSQPDGTPLPALPVVESQPERHSERKERTWGIG